MNGWPVDQWTMYVCMGGWMMSGWAVEMDDGLMKHDGWMDCGWMDRWINGWMDNGKKEENLRSPFSCILPSRQSLLNSQSRRGTAVPSTMCCGSWDTKPQSWVSPLFFLTLSLLPVSLTGFPNCILAPSCPLILRLLVFPHHLSPLLVSLLLPPLAFWTWEKGIHAPPLQLLLTLWSHLMTRILIPDTQNHGCRRQVAILS